jgi:hypothetical protein
MAADNTDYKDTRNGNQTGLKLTGDVISANTYLGMLTILESLTTHTHTFYDDYTTVCECQCQCNCNRGTV